MSECLPWICWPWGRCGLFGFVVEFVEVFFSTSSQSIKAQVYDHLGLFNPPVNQQLLAFHCKILKHSCLT